MGKTNIRLTVTITKDEGVFYAKCEELDIMTWGDTLDEACSMAEEMIVGHFEARRKHGSLNELLASLPHSDDTKDDGAPKVTFQMESRLDLGHSLAS